MSDAGLLPLSGYRIVEFAQLIAGPSAALLLADYGAEVIKVEPPGGDHGRTLRSASTPATETPTFSVYNRNKTLVTLDLRSPDALAVARDLTDSADVVIESARPGVMTRLGLGPDDVMARNPKVIYVSLSGFGFNGPDAARPGVDILVQAESGMMSITGVADGPPTKAGFTVVDAAAGHALCHGVLAALLRRTRTGVGEVVRVSLRDVALHVLAAPVAEYLATGVEPTRTGNSPPLGAPAGVYPCREGAIVVSAALDAHFHAFARAIGGDDLLTDPRFATGANRVRNREALDARLRELLAARSAEAWLKELASHALMLGEVKKLGDAATAACTEGRVVRRVDGLIAVMNPVELLGSEPPAPRPPVAVAPEHVARREAFES